MVEGLKSVQLANKGFKKVGRWISSNDARLQIEGNIPASPGVYAFAIDGEVKYVGLASRSLKQRLGFYRRPGSGQRTNVRLNAKILGCLDNQQQVEILIATPPSFEWLGWEVSGAEGLEAGLIKSFLLPWNQKGKTPRKTAKLAVRSGRLVPPMAGHKYRPLFDFLVNSEKAKISISFAKIEALVGKLPRSAYDYPAWWGNHAGSSQAISWLSAKYRVEAKIAQRSVKFFKV